MNNSNNWFGTKVVLMTLFGVLASNNTVFCTKPTTLGQALMKNDFDTFQTLIRDGADVNGSTGGAAPIIYRAAALGKNKTKFLQALIDAGAEVNITREDGSTPLFRAALSKNDASVKALLKAGANPDSSVAQAYKAYLIKIHTEPSSDGESFAFKQNHVSTPDDIKRQHAHSVKWATELVDNAQALIERCAKEVENEK